MTQPQAYCFYQEFTPEPAKSFQVDRHYLLYAAKGAMQLEAGGRRWSLPPARAALIEAGKPIQITMQQQMTVCSVLFDPKFAPKPDAQLSVFEMTPLARELVLECRQWGPDNGPLTGYASDLFRTLANVTWRLAKNPSPATMPSPKSKLLKYVLELTEAQIDANPSFGNIAATAATTPRSLSRRFAEELGMTWRQALRQMRMIRAIEELAASDQPITNVALSVGYSSLSAFNTAFKDFTGETPSNYRASFRS